jgi:hypothetical protein
MSFARREPDDIARTDLLDVAAGSLHAPKSLAGPFAGWP